MVEVAWKNGIARMVRSPPFARVRLMISLLPRASHTTDVRRAALGHGLCADDVNSFWSVMNCAPGELRSLFATRLIAYLKLAAVTGVPSLKRNPFRMKNV